MSVDFEFLLDDLQAETEASLAARCPSAMLRAVLMALKSKGTFPVTAADRWRDLFEDAVDEAGENAADFIQLLIWYLLRRGSQAMVDTLKKEVPEVEQAARTILDETYDEGYGVGYDKGHDAGYDEGAVSGEKKGVLRSLSTWLQNHPDFETTPQVEARLRAASTDELSRWLERMFQGESPQSLFGSNGHS